MKNCKTGEFFENTKSSQKASNLIQYFAMLNVYIYKYFIAL